MPHWKNLWRKNTGNEFRSGRARPQWEAKPETYDFDTINGRLLDPVTRNGRFLNDYVESEKQNLIDAIRGIINDKRDYADLRLLQEMCRGERYGVDKFGSIARVEKITNQTLFRYYQELLSTAHLELFYCGSAERERVEEAISRAFAPLQRGRVVPPVIAEKKNAPETPREITERMDVTQGRLSMGWRASTNDAPAMMLANLIFGGYSNSKLFLNVREKLVPDPELDRYHHHRTRIRYQWFPTDRFR